ncbi:MAG: DUF2007 domain-containing protein [Alphaproteobacteria bacterium]|nr:DUF2007 domain-containing protein [Alphaproteobacteria bacterium]
MSEPELVEIAVYDNPYAAQRARALLESGDIPCFLFGEHSPYAWNDTGGVRLMVPASARDEARDILRDLGA